MKSFTYVVFIFMDILFLKTLDEGQLHSIISHKHNFSYVVFVSVDIRFSKTNLQDNYVYYNFKLYIYIIGYHISILHLWL